MAKPFFYSRKFFKYEKIQYKIGNSRENTRDKLSLSLVDSLIKPVDFDFINVKALNHSAKFIISLNAAFIKLIKAFMSMLYMLSCVCILHGCVFSLEELS